MKILLFFILSFISVNIFSATCATTTRTNYGYGSVLTSSSLNTDFNQLVTKLNAMPGGCITDGTLASTAMDSSWSAILNGIQQGCKLTYSSASSVSLGKCIATVNGSLIRTSVSNTVTFGCSGCSTQAASTYYYVYIKSGSVGTTVNLLISTTIPGEDGYDASNNKVVGRFYNNVSNSIDPYSIYNWVASSLIPGNMPPTVPGATTAVDTFSLSYGGATIGSACTATPCTIYNPIGNTVSSISWISSANYQINFTKTYSVVNCIIVSAYPGPQMQTVNTCTNCNALPFATGIYNSGSGSNTYGIIMCQGQY